MCNLGTFLLLGCRQRWTTMPNPHHMCSPYLSWKRIQRRGVKNCFQHYFIFIVCHLRAPTWWSIFTCRSAMSESSEPSLGRQMPAWLVILARKAATSCMVYCAERSTKRALCNTLVVVAPLLSPWVWRFRHGFSRGPTGFEIQQDVDAQGRKFQPAILQGGKNVLEEGLDNCSHWFCDFEQDKFFPVPYMTGHITWLNSSWSLWKFCFSFYKMLLNCPQCAANYKLYLVFEGQAAPAL